MLQVKELTPLGFRILTQEEVLAVSGGSNESPPEDTSNFLPYPPWFWPDSDIDDFKEFVVEEDIMDPSALHIDTYRVGEDTFIIEWDGNGQGTVWKVHQNTFTDDDFTFVGNIKTSGAELTTSEAKKLDQNGLTITLSNGVTMKFIWDTPETEDTSSGSDESGGEDEDSFDTGDNDAGLDNPDDDSDRDDEPDWVIIFDDEEEA